jgi:hypothetical protein
MKENNGKKLAIEIFDSLFIMMLCFATLLSAMLLKNNCVSGLDYTIYIKTLSITLLGFGIYLTYMLNRSDKGLKAMIKHVYFAESVREVGNK